MDVFVPAHFHITEVGNIMRNFIDCGGVQRQENKINLQLWVDSDTDHRLKPTNLLNILQLAEKTVRKIKCGSRGRIPTKYHWAI